MMGAFTDAALALHRRGLAVLPTGGEDGKTPLVGGWSRWRAQAGQTVERFAARFPDANVAILTGQSRLTVIDCDDERTLADAESRFGRSPIVTRSPRGGGHLYFRSSGERNANLRAYGLNVDVRGAGGLVLAPPSVRRGIGAYRIERGSWDELEHLTAIREGALPAKADQRDRPQASHATEGERNNSLFTVLRHHAELCVTQDELLADALAINAAFAPPLPMGEAEKVARSVWRMKAEGRLILPSRPRVLSTFDELESLSADAFYFLGWLKRWHGSKQGASFALVPKAMDKAKVLPGWGRRRIEYAMLELRQSGRLVRTHKGGARTGDPSLYRMGARKDPNVTRHPRPRPPSLDSKEKG